MTSRHSVIAAVLVAATVEVYQGYGAAWVLPDRLLPIGSPPTLLESSWFDSFISSMKTRKRKSLSITLNRKHEKSE